MLREEVDETLEDSEYLKEHYKTESTVLFSNHN